MDALLTRRYTKALYQIAERQNVIDSVGADVELIDQVLSNTTKLAQALNNPQIPPTAKEKLLVELFKDQVQPLTLQFINLLAKKRRLELLIGVHGEYQALSDAASGLVRARVQSTTVLTPGQEQNLTVQLERLTGKKVILTQSLDSSLIGGVIVWIGDRVIDGSISGMLRSIEQRLTAV